jgi:hypothetical protein
MPKLSSIIEKGTELLISIESNAYILPASLGIALWATLFIAGALRLGQPSVISPAPWDHPA